MEKSVELIFVPIPNITHLVSTIEFAKLLIKRDDRIRITVLSIKPPSFFPDQSEYIRSVSDSEPRIDIVDLPEIEPPSLQILSRSVESFATLMMESYVPLVKAEIAEIVANRSGSVRVAGLVIDFFCTSMIDAADEFGIDSFIFLPTNAGFLNLMLYISDREIGTGNEFVDSDTGSLPIPGFANSVPPLVLPQALFNKDGGYEAYVKVAKRFRDAKGILVNSFEELEPHAFRSFQGQNRKSQPPVYAVGPVVDLEARAHPVRDRPGHEKLMTWLDDQPPASVLFLCFGTMGGGFGEPQIAEMALAIERSGLRFIWTVREPLPEGFLDRIGGRGVVCGWAPQAQVLAHKSIGGFVSHCGWNSTLESLWNRVPIATWPIHAEQQLNAFLMVRELGGLAVEIKLGGGDLVRAEEIEGALRRLMDGDGEVGRKVGEAGTMARSAVVEGGSSFASIGRFIEDLIGEN